MSQTILITGATGLVGSALIPLLEHNTLHILTTQKSLLHKSTDSIRYFYWEPATSTIDLKAFEGVNVIYHLAGASIAGARWSATRKKEIIDSRILSAQLIWMVLNTNKHQVQHFISASGTGWYTPHSTLIYQEQADGDEHTFLAEVCRQWELAALAFQDLGIKVSMLRTGMVLAPKGGGLDPIKKSMVLPLIPQFGNGKQLVSWITLHDLVHCYKWIMDQEEVGVFNVVANEVVTHHTMMSQLAIAKWKSFLLIPIPTLVLKAVLGQMAEELLMNSIGVSNQSLLQKGFLLQYPNLNSKTLNYLFPPKD